MGKRSDITATPNSSYASPMPYPYIPYMGIEHPDKTQQYQDADDDEYHNGNSTKWGRQWQECYQPVD